MTTLYFKAGSTAQELQDLIDTAPANAEIILAAGQYEFDQTVVIARDDISIAGAGSDQTVITMTKGAIGQAAFQIGHALYDEKVSVTTELKIEASPGDKTIKLASTDGIDVGDVLCIETENTDAFLDSIDDALWRKDTPLRTILVEVEAIDGNVVTLSRELVFDHDTAHTTVSVHDMVTDVHLGGFTVTSGLGTSDAGDFSNTVAAGERSSMILVAGAQDAVLTDIDIIEPVSHGLTLANSIGISVDGLSVEGAHNKGSGGNGYGVWIRNVGDSTLENMTMMDTRHAVVFGSWNTAVGNSLHVLETNRDINFHGGRDTGNSVIVDVSVRDGDEQGYMAANLFFNEGERYGAPTSIEDNYVEFGEVVATVRGDLVYATDKGSSIYTMGSADMVYTAAGNDYVDLGTGHDTVFASAGFDTITGGSGTDTVVIDKLSSEVNFTVDGSTIILWDMTSKTELTRVETFEFVDRTIQSTDISDTMNVTALYEEMNADGLDVYVGKAGWDRAYVTGSASMGADLEAAAYTGADDIALIGSATRNHIMGGSGDDTIEGRGGNDRLLGRVGDDLVLGGDGKDELFGMNGNDTLVGGEGNDTLHGGKGADVFMIDGGTDLVLDFDLADGDTLKFNTAGPDANLALVDFLETGQVGEGLIVEDDVAGLLIGWGDEAVILQDLSLAEFGLA